MGGVWYWLMLDISRLGEGLRKEFEMLDLAVDSGFIYRCVGQTGVD